MRLSKLAMLCALSLTAADVRAASAEASCPGRHGGGWGRPQAAALCTAPWGVDLCAATGVFTAFLFPTDAGGAPLPVGTRWTPFAVWGTNAPGGLPGLPLTYRDGYVPANPADPMEDFAGKLQSIRLVVDPGTPRERAYLLDDPLEVGRMVTAGDYWGPAGYAGLPELNPTPWLVFVPRLRPLPPGVHELQLVFTLSAEHCDGYPSLFGEPLTVEGGHCLPAGDYAYFPTVAVFGFSVVTP